MTKAITLAVEGENGPEVALPNTSADLTGYANADAPGVENVADALDDLFAKSPGNISALTGRVDALESGQVEQDADISAVGAAAADWTASKPGIVQRVEALEALGPGSIYTDSSLTRNENLEYGVNVAPGGPDNYLEKTEQGLAVRGVQTAENELWSRVFLSISKGTNTLHTDYVGVVFGEESTVHPFHSYDDPIISIDADRETLHVLKSGTYHISGGFNAQDSSTSGVSAPIRIYKKVGDTWVLAGTAGSIVGKDNIVRLDIDVHIKLSAGDVIKIAAHTSTSLTFVGGSSLEFQRFADATLLAPALTTMGNEIVAAACGTSTSVISYKSTPVLSGYGVYQVLSSYFAFAPEPRSTPNWENFFEFVKEGTNYVGVKVKKDGVYHARLVVYITNSMNNTIGVGCAWTIVRDGAVANILDNLFNDSIEVNSGGASSVDGHVVLKAGDILWFCVVKEPITTFNITNIVLDVQRFADTLEHPNHGVSRDAGNLAQVGSDLGVMVPWDSGYNSEVKGAASMDSTRRGFYASNNWTDFLIHASKSGWLESREAKPHANGDVELSQLFYDTGVGNLFARGVYIKSEEGAAPIYNNWIGIGAPKPTASNDIGQWKTFYIIGATPPNLPAGGVWAYFLIAEASNGNIVDVLASVAAGGSAISPSPGASVAALYIGFAWRIA